MTITSTSTSTKSDLEVRGFVGLECRDASIFPIRSYACPRNRIRGRRFVTREGLMAIRRMTLRVARNLLLVPLVAVPSWGAAQSAGSRSQAPAANCGGAPVGFHGISGVVCANCVFSYPGEGKPSLFATEPRISNIANNSPAAATLRVGDVLVSVDDKLI